MATSTTCFLNGIEISVERALEIKKSGVAANFRCLECGELVRAHSGGGHTRAHFEHLQRNFNCSLSHNSKSYKYIADKLREVYTREGEALKGLEAYYTTKQRLNQGRFRAMMLDYWGKCCITGVEDPRFLIASHIKPWNICSPEEKMSKDNGLLLIASHDFLFDNFHTTFSETGIGILSDAGKSVAALFGISKNFKISQPLNSVQKSFMEQHRQEFVKRHQYQ
jgi:HNH endonuclease